MRDVVLAPVCPPPYGELNTVNTGDDGTSSRQAGVFLEPRTARTRSEHHRDRTGRTHGAFTVTDKATSRLLSG